MIYKEGTMIRVLLTHHCFRKNSPLGVCFASFIGHSVARSIFAEESSLSPKFPEVLVSSISHKFSQTPCFQQFSSATEPHRILWKGSSNALLLDKLETALKDHRVDEAWEVFNDFKGLYGFPKDSVIGRLIIELSYASDSYWLRKAYSLVLLILNEKPDLLHHEYLTRLALSLVRAQMPIPASTILRLIMEKNKLLSMDLWKIIFIHMVKTDVGTSISSNILTEICEHFLHRKADHNVKSLKCSSLMKPDTVIFNLVLDACVRFRSTLKGQELIELMPQVGAVADAHSIVIIAQIHNMNGQRDELKKFKHHVDGVSVPLIHHYQQFYDSLLSLHFKFNDLDAVSGLVLDLYRQVRSSHKKDLKPCVVPIGSGNPRMGLRMEVKPELLHKDFVCGVDSQPELINFMHGRLVLSDKALAKLIIGFKKDRRIGELSVLLVNIQTELGFSQEADLCSKVINACIQLGWLETAHDILDDMELAGKPISSVMYLSLLRAYCRGNMFREGKALARQMKKVGLLTNLSDEDIISTCLPKGSNTYPIDCEPASLVEKSRLVESLTRELRDEEEEETFSLVYKIDSSIYFFCKAKMMEDALKAYRRMQERNIRPTIHTYFYLINGYSSLGMYREITILWGDIRRRLHSRELKMNRDLQELLLWNFIRGGYFERSMEVISYMIQDGVYIDKWKYKVEFLKFHKGLYRNLKASKAKTEAQIKRLEQVNAFRKWAGID